MRRDLVIFGCESCTPHYMLRALMASGLSAREAARQVEAAESADFAKRSDDKDWKPHQIKRSKNPRMVEKNVRTGAIREIEGGRREKAAGKYDDFIAGATEMGAKVTRMGNASPVAQVNMSHPAYGHPPVWWTVRPDGAKDTPVKLRQMQKMIKSYRDQGYVVSREPDSLIGRMQQDLKNKPHDWQTHAVLADMLAEVGHEQESISHRAQAFPPWQPGQKMATHNTGSGFIQTNPPVPENTARVVLANSLPWGRRRDVLAHLIMDAYESQGPSSDDSYDRYLPYIHRAVKAAVPDMTDNEFRDGVDYLLREPKHHQIGTVTPGNVSEGHSDIFLPVMSYSGARAGGIRFYDRKSNHSRSDDDYYQKLSL
jgi:hypothetical protein